jgi:hypothetical protein
MNQIIHTNDAINYTALPDGMTHNEAITYLSWLASTGDDHARCMVAGNCDYYELSNGAFLIWM